MIAFPVLVQSTVKEMNENENIRLSILNKTRVLLPFVTHTTSDPINSLEYLF